ncbi:FliH/SctL family protein [Roseivivax sediminis]|uniref:Flagellar assembly protein FliH n=1 Tax=Roseivivax sediminis TaxID=936889 RepID=A0A1I1UEW9_9RHOB|nr:ABC transporter ATP-binding protein [Roseivivax sediminis]SFD69145.1 flagellar assembly protein FliH [Roseivivax sediminis]
MTRLVDLLQDFSNPAPRATRSSATIPEAEVTVREERAYETGYRAGWDDAVRAQTEDRERLGGDFAQNLKDLSFTYHEAYSHVLKAMGPLLEEIVETVLPSVLEGGMGAHVVSELRARSAELAGLHVTVAVAPEQVPLVEPLVMREVGFPVDLVADGTLDEGQADIRLADSEQHIDLTDIADGIRDAIAGLTEMSEGQLTHG